MCAHATIAAAYCVFTALDFPKNQQIRFHVRTKSFNVSYKNGWFILDFPKYSTQQISSNILLNNILDSYDIKYIGLSNNVIIVEFTHAIDIKLFNPNLALIKQLPYRAIIITAKDNEYDFVSRYFAPSVGIDEDPVCGSAHCRLFPYWSKILHKKSMSAYQVSNRGGLVKGKVLKNSVLIKGQAVIMERNLYR